MGLSALCVCHCVLTPFAVALLPALAFLGNERIHLALGCVLPSIAILAFVPGYLRHGRHSIFFYGGLGLGLILFAVLFPFVSLRYLWEPLITTLGSVLLIFAHALNRREMAKCEACCGSDL